VKDRIVRSKVWGGIVPDKYKRKSEGGPAKKTREKTAPWLRPRLIEASYKKRRKGRKLQVGERKEGNAGLGVSLREG